MRVRHLGALPGSADGDNEHRSTPSFLKTTRNWFDPNLIAAAEISLAQARLFHRN